MCQASDNHNNAQYGVRYELMSAVSSLNMEPSPKEESKVKAIKDSGAVGYLSEVDDMAEHAMTHLMAACKLARRVDRMHETLENEIRRFCLNKDISEDIAVELIDVLTFKKKECEI